MHTVPISVRLDAAQVLARHAERRIRGIPTVSVLVGPIVAGGRLWRQWAAQTLHCVVVASGNQFPCQQWISAVNEQFDLPTAAIRSLARRAGRDPDEFLGTWRNKTLADRQRLRDMLAPEQYDDLLWTLASECADPSAFVASQGGWGERFVATILHLANTTAWPAVLFTNAGSTENLSVICSEAAHWALQIPTLPIAVALPSAAWAEYISAAPESRTKALLREGEVTVPALDSQAVAESLTEAGAGPNAAAVLTAQGADAPLVESAVALIRATAAAPQSESEDTRARSTAEQFLSEFLESLPETAGRFELNASLDFQFGPRLAEVDLLCREPPIALEIDGYFHFRDPTAYRRDRAKDWELQRRGFLVLRFLAEDVIPHLEMIRDRILDATARTTPGDPS
jgi:hypothetical protein